MCLSFCNSFFDADKSQYVKKSYKGLEVVYVDSVNIIGSDFGAGLNKANITFRIPVNES